jgi:hypothetical protein
MTALNGGWRVLGVRSDGDALLLRPLSEHLSVEPAVSVGPCLSVARDGYDDDLQDTVSSLEPGFRIRAAVESARPGRFRNVSVVDRLVLHLDPNAHGTPTFAAELWKEAQDARTRRDAGQDERPVAASMRLDVDGSLGEAHVVESTHETADDLWWAFVVDEGGESLYGRFEHSLGRPREVIAANPVDEPFFYVVKFEEPGSEAATQIREQLLSGTEPALESIIRESYPTMHVGVRTGDRTGSEAER